MSRLGIWLANALLFVLCCFLAARALSTLAGEWVAGAPAGGEPTAAAPAAPEPSASDHQVILRRNLFNVSTLVASGPVPSDQEILEATKLPLKLLGTAASPDPKRSWAAVEDLESRKHLVVRVDDHLRERARVVRIERRRIVLENGTRREELALEEGQAPGGPRRPGSAAGGIQRTGADSFSVSRSEVTQALQNPATLFSQARILPKYESGSMVGVQLNAIKPGSLFEQIGIQSGDVITQFNGMKIDSPEQSAALLREFTEAKQFSVIVQGADGRERTLSYEIR
jgi:general secretion pathway protein C